MKEIRISGQSEQLGVLFSGDFLYEWDTEILNNLQNIKVLMAWNGERWVKNDEIIEFDLPVYIKNADESSEEIIKLIEEAKTA